MLGGFDRLETNKRYLHCQKLAQDVEDGECNIETIWVTTDEDEDQGVPKQGN